MLTSILAAASKAAASPEAAEAAKDPNDNSAWYFLMKNFVNCEFFFDRVQINLHYGTVALIVLLLIIWIGRKFSRRTASS